MFAPVCAGGAACATTLRPRTGRLRFVGIHGAVAVCLTHGTILVSDSGIPRVAAFCGVTVHIPGEPSSLSIVISDGEIITGLKSTKTPLLLPRTRQKIKTVVQEFFSIEFIVGFGPFEYLK